MKSVWIKRIFLISGITAILLFGAIQHLFASNHNYSLKYAQRFMVEEWSGLKLITVRPTWKENGKVFQYLLVPQGKSVPEKHPPAQIITVPVQSVVSLSTTHLAYIDAAKQTDRLVGVGDFKRINTVSVRRRIDAGKIKEVGYFTSLRIETLLELSPDVILTPASGSIYDVHPRLIEADLPTVLIIDDKENHPLGRLEWIKFLGLLFDTSSHAETFFNSIENRYMKLVRKTADISPKPKIITGAPFQGQWWIAKGNSFVAQFIRDAGGDYLWSKTPGVGSLPMDIEAVYEKALNADIWLNTLNWKKMTDAQNTDPRFTAILAFKQGQLFNNNKRLNPWGGNDFWESGMLNPDVLLADLITIFHPKLLPGHQLVYYRNLK